MARDQVDLTPIEGRDDLVSWIAQGVRPKSQFRIGTEHEKFAFTLEGHRPVPYEGNRGIRALLEGMQHLLGWEPIMEKGNIIGLYDVTGGGAISLEPGGQFELSGAPVENVHQTQSELMAHLAQVREIASPLGIGFLGLGMTPSWSRAQVPVMPKGVAISRTCARCAISSLWVWCTDRKSTRLNSSHVVTSRMPSSA